MNHPRRSPRSSSPTWSPASRRATTAWRSSWHPRRREPHKESDMQKIVPFLWFNGDAEAAAEFYVSIFKNSKVLSVSGPKGKAMSVTFQLEGQMFYALNGGPQYTFTPAISLFVSCETQPEVDELWQKLTAGGSEDQCGWLQDKYGL